MGKHTQNPRVLQTVPTSEAASSITVVQIAVAEKRICWLLLLPWEAWDFSHVTPSSLKEFPLYLHIY